MDNISDMDDKIFARIIHSASKKEKKLLKGSTRMVIQTHHVSLVKSTFGWMSLTPAQGPRDQSMGCLMLVWFLFGSFTTT
jgi:hypothetical protein